MSITDKAIIDSEILISKVKKLSTTAKGKVAVSAIVNTATVFNVVFTKPFLTMPLVFISVNSFSATPSFGWLANISTTGFTGYVFCYSSIDVEISYIAIGV